MVLGMLALIRGFNLVLTAHSYAFCEDYMYRSNVFFRWLQRFLLRRASAIICVNDTIRQELLKIGVKNEKLHVIPAFVPPYIDIDNEKLPAEVEGFCENRSPILVASAAFIFREGQDIYGLRPMVEMVSSLIDRYPNSGLVVYMGNMIGSDESDFKDIIERVDNGDLKSNILFYRSKDEFYPVFKIAGVFLRPTLTDGDAISVRESLYYKVPAICSDAVQRPESVVLYRTMDQQDFNDSVIKVLNSIDNYKQATRGIETKNFPGQIVDIYSGLLAK